MTKENLNKNNSPKVGWTTFRDWQHVGKTAVWNEMAQAEVWSRAFANTVMSHPVHQKAESCQPVKIKCAASKYLVIYEGWNFNSGNYLFTTDTK